MAMLTVFRFQEIRGLTPGLLVQTILPSSPLCRAFLRSVHDGRFNGLGRQTNAQTLQMVVKGVSDSDLYNKWL